MTDQVEVRSRILSYDEWMNFKNINGQVGRMLLSDLLAQSYTIIPKPDGEPQVFEDINSVIEAGWAKLQAPKRR